MISIKSDREIAIMREAGRITALAHKAVANAIRPGITLLELDNIAFQTITAAGATPSFKGYEGFPGSICSSVNEVLVHGIPNDYALKDGDIVSIDIGACYKGYHGDCAYTHPVGAISLEAQKLLEVAQQSLYEGLKMVKPNNRLGDVSHAIQKYVESFHYSLPIEFGGHGIGNELHEDPTIPNIGEPGTGIVLIEGMCLAIEPMVHIGKPHIRVLKDGWTVVSKDKSLTAHFEHTVVITEEGYEILTTLPNKEG